MELYRRTRSADLSIKSGPADGGKRTLSGYAAVFNEWTVLQQAGKVVQREVIRPGAFTAALAENQDVYCTFDHDYKSVLGRTRSGTLRLRQDDRGLWIECDLPDTELGRSVASMVERQDVSGMSFGYLPRNGGEIRNVRNAGVRTFADAEITAANLYDVGPVPAPAYKGTTIQVRGGLLNLHQFQQAPSGTVAEVKRRCREKTEEIWRQNDAIQGQGAR